MNQSLKSECLKAIDELINSKLSNNFLDPIDPQNELYSDYISNIKNPQFLHPIKNKLTENQYKKYTDFEKDVNLVFENARKYYGQKSVQGIIANEMQNKFSKLSKNILISTSTDHWLQHVKSLYNKISEELIKSPPILKGKFNVQKESEHVPRKELSNLVKASEHLQQPDDILGIIQILNAGGVNVDSNKQKIYINLKSVPYEASKGLINFAKERFNELNLKYPS